MLPRPQAPYNRAVGMGSSGLLTGAARDGSSGTWDRGTGIKLSNSGSCRPPFILQPALVFLLLAFPRPVAARATKGKTVVT